MSQKSILQILVITYLIWGVGNMQAFAQNKPKKGTYLPGKSPEQEEKELQEKVEEETKKPDKPLTKRQGYKFMRKRDKRKEEEYKEHHERIQQEETYKRMKKNKKKAEMRNNRKKPNKIRKLFLQI